jgi:hypothetical protein
MLQRLLDDLVLLGHATNQGAGAASGSSNIGNMDSTEAATAEQGPRVSLLPLADAAMPAAAAAAAGPYELASMLDGACALLAGLAEHLEQQQLLELPIMPALQVIWLQLAPIAVLVCRRCVQHC